MPSKPLSELEPEFYDLQHERGVTRVLYFECPACTPGHGIEVGFSGPSIFASGAAWRLLTAEDAATATLTPSIDCTHGGSCSFHGFVTNGVVSW